MKKRSTTLSAFNTKARKGYGEMVGEFFFSLSSFFQTSFKSRTINGPFPKGLLYSRLDTRKPRAKENNHATLCKKRWEISWKRGTSSNFPQIIESIMYPPWFFRLFTSLFVSLFEDEDI